MKFASLMLGAVASLVSTNAYADDLQTSGTYRIAGLAQKNMTYTTTAGAAAARTSSYNGVGSIFVNTVSTGLNSGFSCTASLINATTVLSAAHCIYDHDEATGALDPITRIRLYLPSFGDRGLPTTEVYNATSFAYNPLYNDPNAPGFGDIGSGYDVSLITLDRLATGHDTYSLYTGANPLGVFTEVGTGSSGGPAGYTTNDSFKRVGANTYDVYGDQVFSDVSHGVVMSDFDDGTTTHDLLGRLGRTAGQRGIPGESNSAPGDSGGPEFNAAGQIVSVTSFGITGAVFQGFCGNDATHTGAVDPYHWADARHTGISSEYTTDLSLCTNSSVGELAGNTLVSYNMGFINAYLNGTAPVQTPVPEPATWALMIAGFGVVGGSVRRQRRRAKVSFA